jgi:hypothetical protein
MVVSAAFVSTAMVMAVMATAAAVSTFYAAHHLS